MMALPEGLLVIDKPPEWTSHDVVAYVRKRFNLPKVGHAGTLDPFATGVLLLLIGRSATKLSSCFSGADKEYEATMMLGVATSTGDPEGDVVSEGPCDITESDMQKALSAYRGTFKQTVPMTSAKKVNGRKLYELARKGLEIDRPACEVTIRDLEITGFDPPLAMIRVVCSKGTYMRQLAIDIGNDLGTGAHLATLRRTRSGDIGLEKAIDIETVRALDREGLFEKILRI